MQGLGNDFIVVSALDAPFKVAPAVIRAMADRRFGIGFDQLLVLEQTQQEGIDFHYRIFNADGNEVEQCGNGARCVARYIKEMGLSSKETYRLQTRNGDIELKIEKNQMVSVDMGEPIFDPAAIPFIADHQDDTYVIELEKTSVECSVLSMGNPHAVIEVKQLENIDVEELGRELCHHECFPKGVNVGFMQVDRSDCIHLRVYERGANETLACGSGACAAVVAGRQKNILDERVRVIQQGGDLDIYWPGPGQSVQMSGPAEFVFIGEYLLQ